MDPLESTIASTAASHVISTPSKEADFLPELTRARQQITIATQNLERILLFVALQAAFVKQIPYHR